LTLNINDDDDVLAWLQGRSETISEVRQKGGQERQEEGVGGEEDKVGHAAAGHQDWRRTPRSDGPGR